MSTLLYAVEGAVATITLNRPQVLNALDEPMIMRLREACEQARGDSSVRAIVLAGNGPAFMAGGDVTLFHAHLSRLPQIVERLARELHFAILALRRAPKPVIAAVHGACAGAGVSLVAAADLAIAADDAQFMLAYSKLGTSPDGGSTYFLPRLLGSRKALELMLLSEAFDAATALSFGLVNRVVPSSDLAAGTHALAHRLAQGPTFAYAQTKRLVESSFEHSIETQLEAETQAFARCAGTADLAEGVRAFVGKRKPAFGGT